MSDAFTDAIEAEMTNEAFGHLLSESSTTINRAGDIVNARFGALEHILRRLNVGISASVDKNTISGQVCLSYGRIGKQYTLGIEVAGKACAWNDCTRGQKMDAEGLIPALQKEIIKEAERLAKKADPILKREDAIKRDVMIQKQRDHLSRPIQ